MPGPQFFRGAIPIFFRRSFRTAPALPKSISECGDVLLFGFVSDYAGAMPGHMRLLSFVQVSLVGVLKGLSGAFMSGQVILLSVMLGAGAMGVGGKVTAFRSDPLRFVHNHCQSTRGAVCREAADKGPAPREIVRKLSPEVQDLLEARRFHRPAGAILAERCTLSGNERARYRTRTQGSSGAAARGRDWHPPVKALCCSERWSVPAMRSGAATPSRG